MSPIHIASFIFWASVLTFTGAVFIHELFKLR